MTAGEDSREEQEQIVDSLFRFLAIIGGEMDGEVLNSMKMLDLETDE